MSLLVCDDCTSRRPPDVEVCPQCGGTGATDEGAVAARGLPSVTVECRSEPCSNARQSRVMLHVSGGFVTVPRLRCDTCGADAYVVHDWPPPKEDVMGKIRNDGAVKATIRPAGDDVTAASPASPVEVADGVGTGPGVVGTEAPADTGPVPSDTGVGVSRPVVNDPKEAWVTYGVSLGLVREAAEALSKRDLIEVVKAVEDGAAVNEDGTVTLPDTDV